MKCELCKKCCSTNDVLILKEQKGYVKYRGNNCIEVCDDVLCSMKKPKMKELGELPHKQKRLFLTWYKTAKEMKSSFLTDGGLCRHAINIKDAVASDLPEILNVYKKCYQSTDRLKLPDAWTVENIEKQFKKSDFTVLSVGDKIVATHMRTVRDKKCQLDHLATLPDYRRLGLSSIVLNWEYELLKSQVVFGFIEKNNSYDLREFYKKQGWKEAREYNYKGTEVILIEKQL